MSHFSVLVTGDDVDKALAPYDENLEVPRYLARTREQIIADGRRAIEDYRTGLYAEYLADPDGYAAKCKNEAHLRYLRESFPEKLEWTDDQVYADEIKWIEDEDLDDDGAEWSDRNPKSKWDYWRVGGRWARHLVLREGASPIHNEPLSWEWTDYPSDDRPPADPNTHADVARKGDVDLDETYATYAILHDGQWVARGEMGWFGISHDEQVPEDEWPAKWREFVASLPDDTRLTIVDCHI